MNEQWIKERAELEKQLEEAKQTVLRYQRTSGAKRTVTESEYQRAFSNVLVLSTKIANGNHEAGRPAAEQSPRLAE
ncbi:hypothetical protein AB1K91_02605 [Terribacillus sp. 179-K 1B1 HS]|uniref:hypothetical protein n=1 Tax=Terribacillus sp. 179-K 1B1 HS TaxID=3142388 RepID=UPI00399F5EFF